MPYITLSLLFIILIRVEFFHFSNFVENGNLVCPNPHIYAS